MSRQRGRGGWPPSRSEQPKIAVPVVAIGVVLTNVAGLWETEHQEATRLRRAAQAEETRQDVEDRRKREKHWQDFWRDVERDFRRQ